MEKHHFALLFSSMCMVMRKKKILSFGLLVIVLMTTLLHWKDIRATWQSTVIMQIQKYQLELRRSVDFSELKKSIVGNYNNSIQEKIDLQSVESRANALLKNAKMCLKHSRGQISMYLMRSFEVEFSVEQNAKGNTNTMLEPKCEANVDLIIILTTRPGAFYNRAAIRNSWGRQDSLINKFLLEKNNFFNYKTIFIVGRDRDSKVEQLVEEEYKYYGDILRLDYTDKYENLTNKTILSLEWLAMNCPSTYVLKTDDDCFVNLIPLITWLKELGPSEKYIGKKNEFMPVIRDPTHRNYVSISDYAEEYYKPYCSGGGYMIAGDILKNLTAKAKLIGQIINEDAYIGLVMNDLKISPSDDERFLPYVFTKKGVNKRTMCSWREKFLMHGVEPEMQIHMHWTTLAMRDYPSICEGNYQVELV